MAYVVETGAGLADATAYNSLVGIVALLAERGLTLPAGDDAANQAASVQATLYIDGRYSFVGRVRNLYQALAWPRIKAYDLEGREIRSNIVPLQVLRAHAFLTYQARLGDLQVVEEGTGGSSAGGTKSFKVGPIAKEFFQATTDTSVSTQKRFVEVDTLLANLLSSPVGSAIAMARLVRA